MYYKQAEEEKLSQDPESQKEEIMKRIKQCNSDIDQAVLHVKTLQTEIKQLEASRRTGIPQAGQEDTQPTR